MPVDNRDTGSNIAKNRLTNAINRDRADELKIVAADNGSCVYDAIFRMLELSGVIIPRELVQQVRTSTETGSNKSAVKIQDLYLMLEKYSQLGQYQIEQATISELLTDRLKIPNSKITETVTLPRKFSQMLFILEFKPGNSTLHAEAILDEDDLDKVETRDLRVGYQVLAIIPLTPNSQKKN